MLHRTAWMLAAVLFLIPGNLMAVVLHVLPATCEDQGCGCPAPDQDASTPAVSTPCCCELQPGETPQDEPSDPLQAPKWPSSVGSEQGALSIAIPGATQLEVRCGERPDYLAHPPPDPLFLRYQSLRL